MKVNGPQTLSMLAVAALPQFGELPAADGDLDQLRPPASRKLAVSKPEERGQIEPLIVNSDFVKDATLCRDRAYLIHGEVHVRAGVTLTIEDGTTILIRNGLRPVRTIDTSALIFDSGSGLRAGTITFASADGTGARVKQPNNGGVFFCGSHKKGTKDGISSTYWAPSSNFRAERIILDHVGRTDPREGDGDNNDRDDIDAISIIGVGQREWNVKAIESHGSGDDGIDIYNSTISLDTLIVTNPVEDGVNMTSSNVKVHCYCSIDMSESAMLDRELFDFELDNGPCRFTIEKNALAKMSGFWGSEADDVRLKSPEMPQPPTLGSSDARYEFNGTVSRRSIISSAKTD